MYQNLELFRTAAAMAQHAGARQALTARNVANADTPGYQAMKIPAFSESYSRQAASTAQQTRPGHMVGGNTAYRAVTDLSQTEPSPNGNTVSIEHEMLNSVAISREHNRALAIYRHTMTVLRTTLGR